MKANKSAVKESQLDLQSLTLKLNLLIDEAQSCGKGANSVVIMVHHYLQHFVLGEGKVCLQADNCVAQNINNNHGFIPCMQSNGRS